MLRLELKDHTSALRIASLLAPQATWTLLPKDDGHEVDTDIALQDRNTSATIVLLDDGSAVFLHPRLVDAACVLVPADTYKPATSAAPANLSPKGAGSSYAYEFDTLQEAEDWLEGRGGVDEFKHIPVAVAAYVEGKCIALIYQVQGSKYEVWPTEEL